MAGLGDHVAAPARTAVGSPTPPQMTAGKANDIAPSEPAGTRLPRGPRTPAWSQTLRLHRDPVGALQDWADRYGECFTLRLLFVGTLVVVTNPVALKQIFTGDPAVFRAGEATAKLLPILGAGSILLADGEQHLRRRRRLLPVFHGEGLADHATWIAELVERECDRWPVGRPTKVLPRAGSVTFEVIARLVLGPMEQARVDELRARLTRMLSGTSILASWYPWPLREFRLRGPWARLEGRQQAVDELLLVEIRRHRAQWDGTAAKSALAALVIEADGIPTPSDAELCDELRSLLIVGYETTAAALAWAITELARSPAVVEQLLVERADGAGRYMDAVIQEALRLRTPVVDAVRMLARPVMLNGLALPAGTIVMVALPLVHRRSDLFVEPDLFRPERFFAGRAKPDSYVPFGGGVRRCLGASLTMLALRVALGVILERFRFRRDQPEPERAKLLGTALVPARGARVIVERRM